jgi:hypothetical protein
LPPMENVTRNPYHNIMQDTESLRFNNQIGGGSQGIFPQPKRYGIVSQSSQTFH